MKNSNNPNSKNRTCKQCTKTKPLKDFSFTKNPKTGKIYYRTICKKCVCDNVKAGAHATPHLHPQIAIKQMQDALKAQGQRYCLACNSIKDYNKDFYHFKKGRHRVSTACKSCIKKRNSGYYYNNKGKKK